MFIKSGEKSMTVGWRNRIVVTAVGSVMAAHAYLGNTHSWGAKSQYNTKAEVNGNNFTHNAVLLRNGSVWAKAQG